MQIHELNSRTPNTADYIALDTGSQTYKSTTGDLKPGFTTGDASDPTAWTDVTTITAGLSFTTLLNRITTMIKNVRYLWGLIGNSSFSNVASTISEAIGNTALGTTATTLSGAIAEHESDISTINGNLSVTGIYNLGLAIDVKPASFNVPSNSRHFLLITGPYSARGHAIYAVSCNNSGAVYAYKIGGTDDMPTSASGSSGSLTISSTSTASVTCDICDICLYGNKITIPS